MTQNQINYWRVQEDKRHNQAEEAVKSKEAQIKSDTLEETKRHNLDVEDMERNKAVYEAYKNVRQGDEAATKKWKNAAEAVSKVLNPLASIFG